MVPLALSLAVDTQPPVDPPEPPPPAVLSPTLDPQLLQLSIDQHRRARALGWTAVGGLAATIGGVGMIAGACSSERCEGPVPAVGLGLAFVGSLTYSGALWGFTTVNAIAEGNARDAGLRIRPRLGWAPLALTVGGSVVAAATILQPSFAGAGDVTTTPPGLTVGSLLITSGIVLSCVQFATTGTAQRRRLTVAMAPNGARATVQF